MIDPENVRQQERIILTVDIAVIFDEKQLLLIKRKYPPFEDKLVLPGGHVDPGERMEDAARRELAEETGLILGTNGELDFLMVLDAPDRDPRPDGRRVSIVYWVNVPETVFSKLKAGSDAKELQLKRLDELTEDELGFDHFTAIKKIRRWQEFGTF